MAIWISVRHMPIYEPIATGIPIRASRSDLLAFQWEGSGITADFALPEDDTKALRVSFDRPCIVRLLDELPLSTEEDDTSNAGLLPDNFAYRLKEARFARTQSEAWKAVFGPVIHYQFITGDTCMDVLSGGAPSFSVVPRSS